MTGRWRLAFPALLVGVACLFGVVINAGANHSVTNWLSTSPTGGNGAFDASVEGFSDDGSRAFFQTDEQMVAADTDSRDHHFDRAAATTTRLSTGPIGGTRAYIAPFFVASG